MSSEDNLVATNQELEVPRKEWTPTDMEFPDCGSLYSKFLVCVKPRYQVTYSRRHGTIGPCNELFSDWGNCLYSRAVTKPGAKEEIYKASFLYQNYLAFPVNDVFEYKETPSWDG